MTRLLIWVQWRQLVHRGLSRRGLVSVLAVILVGAVFLSGLTAGSVVLAHHASRDTFEAVASYGLLLLVIALLLADLPQIFNQLFSSRDVELLFTLPIPTRSIFLVKYGQSLLGTGLIAAVVALIPVLSYGAAGGVSWLFYPVALLVIVGAVAGIVALCYLLSLALVQVVPPRRAREFMTALTMLLGLAIALSGQLFSHVSTARVTRLNPLPLWLPMRWGADAVAQAADGDARGLLPLAGLLALALGLLAVSTLLVERSFRLGWVQQSEGGGSARKRARRKATADLSARPVTAARPLHRTEIAIGLKEARMLRRDVREWMQLVPFVVFYAVIFFQILGGGRSGIRALETSRGTLWLLIQTAILFSLTFVGTNFAAPALAREGTSIWLLRSVPISGRQMALGKFWVYWSLPAALLLLVEVTVGIAMGWPLSWIVGGIAALAVLISGAVALGIWVGTFAAQYNPDRPQQRLPPGVGLMLFVVNFIYFILAVLPAAVTLLPTSLEPDLTAVVGQTGGLLHAGLRFALYVVRQKAAHSAAVTILGALWLIAFGLGIAALTLWLTARRVDAGVQVRIIEGK